jgi:hypothetical protein
MEINNYHENLRPYYFVCASEKLIYHSIPDFECKTEISEMKKNGTYSKKEAKILLRKKEQMYFRLGISHNEKWKKVSQETALRLAFSTKESPFFRVCTTKQYHIKDCPELEKLQKLASLEGHLIDHKPTNAKRKLNL